MVLVLAMTTASVILTTLVLNVKSLFAMDILPIPLLLAPLEMALVLLIIPVFATLDTLVFLVKYLSAMV